MSFRKTLVLMLVALLAVFSFTGCKKKKDKEAENVLIIGGQNPESGAMADYGSKTVMGAEIAFEEINAQGGVNGKQIKFLHYDSRGDKKEAVNVTRRLLNENVCAIIGEITSGGFFAMRDIANDGGTVAISTGATAQNATEKKNGDKFEHIPFAFRNTLQDSNGAPALVKYIIEKKGLKKFALITSRNNEYSVGLSKFFSDAVKANGGEIVIEKFINDGDVDMSAPITSIKQAGVDAIIFTGYYQEASQLLLKKAELKLNIPLIGGDGLQSPDLWNIAKDAAVGTIFYAGFAADSDNANVKSFIEKMGKQGKEADTFSANGYDAAYLLVSAMKAANITDCSDKAQRDALRAELLKTKGFEGITGTTSMDETGSAVKDPFIQEVVKNADGTFGTKVLH